LHVIRPVSMSRVHLRGHRTPVVVHRALVHGHRTLVVVCRTLRRPQRRICEEPLTAPADLTT
jgi:hypothetical protein